MKTQLSILVKNETFYTRFFGGGLWFINIFKKLPLDVVLDGNKQRLKAAAEPYVFDVTPGEHSLQVIDPRARTKKRDKALTGAIFGAAAVGAAGGPMTLGAALGASGIRAGQDGLAELYIEEGATLKISCQATRNGDVNIKQL